MSSILSAFSVTAPDVTVKSVESKEAKPVTELVAVLIFVLLAEVNLPWASTVNEPTAALVPYDPGVTAVSSRFKVMVFVEDATDESPVPPDMVTVSASSIVCDVPESPAKVKL